MKNLKKIAFIILFQVLLVSCGVSNQNKANSETEVQEPDSNISYFFVFNIHKNKTDSANMVELVSKKEIIGKMNSENTNRGPNYLTLYLYSGKQLVDTISIDHPLYKHYEYVNQNNAFAFKDTLIDKADFVIRSQRKISEIKIFETLKNQPKKQLTTTNF